ncbi:5-carboxymethyl-2-hydroxymuconate Delta-isomerase [Streptomyces tsukubensis]|uniref:Isomerase n=1 Tax=Streptomyces tsukubensis TaxID=83656 RepID=A0A1V4A378_9ACTN|nr:isomerase [Streptomyces tsukubensis]OON73852.1 isomerase [Streptomyces tsukubensis]QFR91775.1 isomerase [Streptomyces tsukubensis]
MPQITVDHSAALTAAFDPAALAEGLHAAVVEIAAATPAACKTQFRPGSFTAVGHDTEGHAVLHVTIGLLAGRAAETKARLTEAVLELVGEHVRPDGLTLHASAETRDLDASYRKFDA